MKFAPAEARHQKAYENENFFYKAPNGEILGANQHLLDQIKDEDIPIINDDGSVESIDKSKLGVLSDEEKEDLNKLVHKYIADNNLGVQPKEKQKEPDKAKITSRPYVTPRETKKEPSPKRIEPNKETPESFIIGDAKKIEENKKEINKEANEIALQNKRAKEEQMKEKEEAKQEKDSFNLEQDVNREKVETGKDKSELIAQTNSSIEIKKIDKGFEEINKRLPEDIRFNTDLLAALIILAKENATEGQTYVSVMELFAISSIDKLKLGGVPFSQFLTLQTKLKRIVSFLHGL